ncbi:MAG: 16S rRNA (cytidine(1402)-2'-O)-methyltransferase [Gammaproteobacteria bacterium]
MSEYGTLYVIATPIGNLADITLRALDIIKNVKTLYAEDTRVTKHLLEHYGIQAKLQSLHDFNESKKISSVIEQLQSGADIGLVSDAGTPLISDPGYKLVVAVQEADFCVRSIPGPSSLTAALSIAGVPTDRFIFEGFFPKSSTDRVKLLKNLRFEARTMIFYESAQRIQSTIEDCIAVMGGERKVALMRELTKHYEQHICADLEQVQQQLIAQTEKIRGEIVFILHGDNSSENAALVEKARQLLVDMQPHMPLKEAAAIVSKHTGIRRNQLYSLGLQEKGSDNSNN